MFQTGIASSLRDLPWLASSDPMDFFPRCYLLSEDEKEDLIGKGACQKGSENKDNKENLNIKYTVPYKDSCLEIWN